MISRTLYSIFCTGLLFALSLFTLLYLHNESVYFKKSFQDSVAQETVFLKPFFETLNTYSSKLQLKGAYGILIVFAILALFVFFLVLGQWIKRLRLKEKAKKLSKAPFILVFLTILLTGGLLAGIYFWPENEINLGFFKIQRGSPENFINQVFDISLLVIDAHVFLFLCFGLIRCVFWKEKKGKNKN